MHTDMDYFLSDITVHAKEKTGSIILQYFCFPTIGVSVGLRNGDVLLFNPTVPHCISSPTSDKHDCFSMSAYLKAKADSFSLYIQPHASTTKGKA
jgi:hypothetical protein